MMSVNLSGRACPPTNRRPPENAPTQRTTMASRLAQVSAHISNAHGRGLLADEVAIITGALVGSHRQPC